MALNQLYLTSFLVEYYMLQDAFPEIFSLLPLLSQLC